MRARGCARGWAVVGFSASVRAGGDGWQAASVRARGREQWPCRCERFEFGDFCLAIAGNQRLYALDVDDIHACSELLWVVWWLGMSGRER